MRPFKARVRAMLVAAGVGEAMAEELADRIAVQAAVDVMSLLCGDRTLSSPSSSEPSA